jgi:rubrerythrin
MLLLRDMTEAEQDSVRSLYADHLPEGTRLVEIVPMLWSGWNSDTHVALVEHSDGHREALVVAMVSTTSMDPLVVLQERASAYEATAEATRRFIAIARGSLGLPEEGSPWRCSACGTAFHDQQPVPCPACEELTAWGSGNVWEGLGLPDQEGPVDAH